MGADGILGDQVVKDLATANAVVASFDNVTVAEWERELTSIVTPARRPLQEDGRVGCPPDALPEGPQRRLNKLIAANSGS